MIIGVPKEIKPQENRVGITPAGVDALVKAGHIVYIERDAGAGSGFADGEYAAAGAAILPAAKDVYDAAEMIIKVKEPLAPEYPWLKEGQILFTYLHLAPDPQQTAALLRQKVVAIAYETVQLADHSLPLLAPMSEVAGRMSIQVGAQLLEKIHGGSGILLGGVPGVEAGKVAVVGGGNVGINAIKMAVGLGAQVTVLDVSVSRLSHLDDIFNGRIVTLISNSYNIAKVVKEADLVVGAVLIPGAKAPKLVREDMVKAMRPGSVLVDVAIDQGGSIETIDRVTTHENPCFIKHGVVHYSVANMPGAVPRTSTFALTNATLPYALRIADKGAERAMREDPALLLGLNTYKGQLTYEAVAKDQGLPYTPAASLF
ncbi:MAG: alanine dehydrogenase [Peptococcaceae bacterium]|nr:alanine dehydrogenase [Peptococcaceae bacterium]